MKIGITERGDASFHVSELVRKAQEYDLCIWITKAPYIFTSASFPFGIPKNVIIHCTITGFGDTMLEPNVNPPSITLESYFDLVKLYGGERIVLRVDPILPYNIGVTFAENVIKYARGRVRISFMDLYPHVKERFNKFGIDYPVTSFHAPLKDRLRFLEYLQLTTSEEIEVCGEPGIPCTGCVSERDIKAIGLDFKSVRKSEQRKNCNCFGEKTELLINNKKSPCKHGCLYCYWKD